MYINYRSLIANKLKPKREIISPINNEMENSTPNNEKRTAKSKSNLRSTLDSFDNKSNSNFGYYIYLEKPKIKSKRLFSSHKNDLSTLATINIAGIKTETSGYNISNNQELATLNFTEFNEKCDNYKYLETVPTPNLRNLIKECSSKPIEEIKENKSKIITNKPEEVNCNEKNPIHLAIVKNFNEELTRKKLIKCKLTKMIHTHVLAAKSNQELSVSF